MNNSIYKAVSKNQLTKLAVSVLAAAVLVVAAGLIHKSGTNFLQIILYALSIAAAVGITAIISIERLLSRRFSSELFAILGILAVFLSGSQSAAATAAIIFGFGSIIAQYARENATKKYFELSGGELCYNVLQKDGGLKSIPASKLKSGYTVAVNSGDYICFDGKIGSKTVYAGSNIDEDCEIKINSVYDVEIDFEKAAAVTGGDKFISVLQKISVIYSLILFICGICYAAADYLALSVKGDLRHSLFIGAVFALMSLSAVINSGIFEAYVLKNAALSAVSVNEKYSEIKNLIVNKSRILMRGMYTVADVYCSESYSENQVISLCAAVQNDKNNPFAKAFFEKLGGMPDKFFKSKTIDGMGIAADVNGMKVYVGSALLMSKCGISVDTLPEYTVYVCADGVVIGAVKMTDRLKGSAVKEMQRLRERGIRTFIVSSDNERTVAAVAKECNAFGYRALCDSDKKAAFVDELRAAGITAYFGDDKAALKAADIGISCIRNDEFDYLPEDGLSLIAADGSAKADTATVGGAEKLRFLLGLVASAAVIALCILSVMNVADFWIAALISAVFTGFPPILLCPKNK